MLRRATTVTVAPCLNRAAITLVPRATGIPSRKAARKIHRTGREKGFVREFDRWRSTYSPFLGSDEILFKTLCTPPKGFCLSEK